MKNDHYAWFTLFDNLFDRNKYLYHFTDIQKVAKILDSNSLKFAKISKTNDTLESKPRINERLGYNEFIEQFKQLNQECVQLLCFSTDDDIDINKKNFKVSERMKYSDFSGRGFALPRMWAQYAENNSGICLIFDRDKLASKIKKQINVNYIYDGKIEYKSQFDVYPLHEEHDQLIKDLIKDVQNLNKKNITVDFLKTHLDFVKYNYFSKLDDWAAEREYRFLAFGKDEYYIENIYDALVGVIIGEKTAPSDIKIIKMFADKETDIKKISFTFNGCKLENIN